MSSERTPHELIAIEMMATIACDCGANSYLERKAEEKNMSKKHIRLISIAAGRFFDKHPHLLTDEVLEDIAIGEESEKQEKYGSLEGFKELDDALNNYFEQL